MKNILFVIPSLGAGGAERVLVNLVNELDKFKYDVSVFSIFGNGVHEKNLNDDINYDYFFKKQFRGNIHLFKLFSPKNLYKKVIKKEYDIIVSYLEGPATRIVSGCPFENTILINWVHTELKKKHDILQSYRSLKEVKTTYMKFSKTVFVSESARSAFKNVLPSVLGENDVIYNAIDASMILSQSNETVDDVEFDKSKVNIISIGRFIESKGFNRLIDIMALLIKDFPQVHLYLIGRGKLETAYVKKIKELNLEEYITILGFKSNPHKYTKAADLFVCSSFTEGYSTVVTESLIIGTPVVTTLCSGMEELLGQNNEYGLITKNEDEALYLGIKQLLNDKELLNKYKEQAILRGKQLSLRDNTKVVESMFDSFK